MAQRSRLIVPARILAGCLLLALPCFGCGSPDTKGAAPATTAQPAGSQSHPGQAPSPAVETTPQVPAQPRSVPVRPDRDAAAREPEGVAPVITGPPEDRVVVETGPFSLKVVAKGTSPLAYQWTKEGRPEIVSNEAEFWMVPKIEDSGTYTVEVSNRWGKATAFCRLTVNPRLKRP